VDLPELQGDDPILIAKEKCALAAKEVNGAVITEDTSLCFTALNGLPGPYIKWFLDKNGLDGLNDMIAFSEDKVRRWCFSITVLDILCLNILSDWICTNCRCLLPRCQQGSHNV
jgi:inosine/xanthosine triphosphate pyrophosphatase family protein